MANVHLEWAPADLFRVRPAPLPTTLPAPTRIPSFAAPFNVSPQTYNELLSFHVPVTIAVIYATTVWSLNRFNKGRKNKPWRVSRKRAFCYFVVAHNLVLAVYSGWTTLGMFRAVRATVPALGGDWTLARLADSLCKLNGPRGFGNAVFYTPTNNAWRTSSRSVIMLGGKPDTDDVGRLWNEGLGYYGWLFYLSKFYEVVDTLIILAKGKKSSLLQTYHHAGAMVCMWAGIRYMSPPIWMFVQINSFIHTLMYSYYTVSALGIRVPVAFKKTLTTMQIVQLVGGVSYALLHLIISYDAPLEASYVFTHQISNALPTATSDLLAEVSPNAGNWLKRVALRAAGEQGLAANVGRSELEPPVSAATVNSPWISPHEEVRYHWTNERVHCIDTSGQVFAILLNVIYLMPLTYLFVRFFIRAYLRRVEREVSSKISTTHRLRASSEDAVKGVEREIIEAMSATQGSYSDYDLSGKSRPSSANGSPRISTGAITPLTVKPVNGKSRLGEAKWVEDGQAKVPEQPSLGEPLRRSRSPSPSPSEARRSAEEAVRRAYAAAELAARTAKEEEEADSIISVETTLTVESVVDTAETEARQYEVTGVDEILNTEEVKAEETFQAAPV